MVIEKTHIASDEKSVSSLYRNKSVAETYVEKRLMFSWQRLLHNIQVSVINKVIQEYKLGSVMEIAPGPARLTVDVKGVSKGFLVEFSEEMLGFASQRLREKGLSRHWKLIHGNAFELSQIKAVPESVDFIYTFRFIRHFHRNDRLRLYKAIHSKLSQGGFLMFDVVNKTVRDKLDSRTTCSSQDALAIYDATYTKKDFHAEMSQNGFEIVSMTPVIRHFQVQSWLSYKFDDISRNLVQVIVNLIEQIPSQQPLEWIALCRAR